MSELELGALEDRIQVISKLSTAYSVSKMVPNWLIELNRSLIELEGKTSELTAQIADELEALKDKKTIIDALNVQKQTLMGILATVPAEFEDIQMTEPPIIDDEELDDNDQEEYQMSEGRTKNFKTEAARIVEPVKRQTKRTELEPLDAHEFEGLPKYIVGRLQLEKLNLMIDEFNLLIKDKLVILAIPQPKMSKDQRNLFWEHRECHTPETKGKAFVTEQDLRAHGWSTSKFKFDAVGRNVITILRNLGFVYLTLEESKKFEASRGLELFCNKFDGPFTL